MEGGGAAYCIVVVLLRLAQLFVMIVVPVPVPRDGWRVSFIDNREDCILFSPFVRGGHPLKFQKLDKYACIDSVVRSEFFW